MFNKMMIFKKQNYSVCLIILLWLTFSFAFADEEATTTEKIKECEKGNVESCFEVGKGYELSLIHI